MSASAPRVRGGAEAGRSALLVVGAVLAVALMWALRSIVMMVTFAMLLAYALDPLVGRVARLPWLRGGRLPRPLAAGLVMAGLVAIAVWTAIVVTPQLASEVVSLFTGLPERLQILVSQLSDQANEAGYGGAIGPMVRQFQAALPQIQSWLLSWLGKIFGNALQLAGLVVLPVLAFYLLAERGAVQASMLRFIPADAHRQVQRIGGAVDRALASYVRGQAIVCAVSGASMTVWLTVLGVSHALLLGFLVALAEILPFLGFWIAATAIVLIALGESPLRAAMALGIYILSNSMIGLLVTPRVMGRHLKLHPFVVTVSVLAGGELLGPPGVLLALPAAAIAQAIVELYASSGEFDARSGEADARPRR